MPRLVLELPSELDARLREEAKSLGLRPEERVLTIVDEAAGKLQPVKPAALKKGLNKLRTFLARVPGVEVLSVSEDGEPYWFVKLSIDIDSPLAWRIVQELGHVLNYISISERLPTVFMPVSPPPYMNGGPEDYLSWVIECRDPSTDPGDIARVLEGHLPKPVDDEDEWDLDGEDEEDEE